MLLCDLASVLPPPQHPTEPGEARDQDQGPIAMDGTTGIDGFFYENRGQVPNRDVLFYASGDPLSVGLERDRVVFTLSHGPPLRAGVMGPMPGDEGLLASYSMQFEGCEPVVPTGSRGLGCAANFFLGNDPDDWTRDVASYSEVVYRGIYKCIDLRFYFSNGSFKYDYVLLDGAEPRSILLRYVGITGLSLDPTNGDLIVTTPAGLVRDRRPVLFEGTDHSSPPITGGYRILEPDLVGFEIPDALDASRPFVIDPGLEFSTFLGGTRDEIGETLALDPSGDLVLVGWTYSIDFPITPGSYQVNRSSRGDAFVTMLDPTGSQLVFSTFIGGCAYDRADSVQILSNGELVVIGSTDSGDFPVTADAMFSTSRDGTDIFMLKLCADGTDLMYSSYFGGHGDDEPAALGHDGEGNLYIAGTTDNRSLPVTDGAYCRTVYISLEEPKIFVASFDSSLSHLNYCTYIDGMVGHTPFTDAIVLGFDVDDRGVAYIGGPTAGEFPTSEGAFDRDFNGGPSDGFVLKLDPTGSSLSACTLLGGSGLDCVHTLTVASDGAVYCAGCTLSVDFPTTQDALYTHALGNYDAFLTVLDGDLSRCLYSTFLGGRDGDVGVSVAIGGNGGVLGLLGITSSMDLRTTVGCFDTTKREGPDLFLLVLDRANLTTRYSTYIGGSGDETACYYCLASDDEGAMYCIAMTDTTDFPTTAHAYCDSLCGGSDVVVWKVDPAPCGVPRATVGLAAERGDENVTLRWDRPPSDGARVLRHIIYRGETREGLAMVGEVPWPANEFLDTELENGVTYCYAVSAVSSAGEGPRNETSARPLGSPSPPPGLEATTGNGTVTLAWSPPTDTGGELLGYRIFRGRQPGPLAEIESDWPLTSYVDRGVKARSTYSYAVLAFNGAGVGAMSDAVTIGVVARPSQPQGFRATPQDERVLLSWEPPLDDGGSPITGYRVYRGTSVEGLQPISERRPTDLAFIDVGRRNGAAYYYNVAAMTSAGEGVPTQTLMSIPFGPPSAPRFLVAMGEDCRVLLSWSAPLDCDGRPVTGYRLYYGESPGAIALSIYLANVTSYTHSNLVNGIVYYYELAAINEAGEGPLRSATVSAIPLGLPGAPLDLVAERASDCVALSWLPPNDRGGVGLLDFHIHRCSPGGQFEPLACVTEGFNYYDSDVDLGATYSYYVECTNGHGVSEPSRTVWITLRTVPGPVGGLVATAGDGRVSLSWSPPALDGGSPITEYLVLRGASMDFVQMVASTCTALSYNDTAVENGLVYYYAVSAANVAGTGARSPVANATPLGPPGAVDPVIARVRGDSVRLTWRDPQGFGTVAACGYIVLRGTTPGALERVGEVGTGTSFTDPDVVHGTTYYYCVVANSSLGPGPPSQLAEVSVGLSWAKETRGVVMASVLVVLASFAAVVARSRMRREHGEGPAGTVEGAAGEGRAPPPPPAAAVPRQGGPRGYVVEQVLLVHQDGRLILDAARPDSRRRDADVMSGMLIALQSIIQFGVEGSGDLESVKYGENLILKEAAERVVLAAVIIGEPDDRLREELKMAVAEIDRTYATALERWSGDPVELAGIEAMVRPIIGSTEHLDREGIRRAARPKDISILSATDFAHGLVRLKVAVANWTDDIIVDAAIEIRYDHNMLRLEYVEPPSLQVRGDRAVLGHLRPDERKTVAYLLDPQICQGTFIDGSLTYYDTRGEYHRVSMKRRRVEVVCPVFFTREHANTAMLRRLMAEKLRAIDSRAFRFPESVDPSEMFAIGRSALEEKRIQRVQEHEDAGPPYSAEAWYYGETKAKGYQIVMHLSADGSERVIDLEVASTSMGPITGLLSEFRMSVGQLLGERHAAAKMVEIDQEERAHARPTKGMAPIDEGDAKG